MANKNYQVGLLITGDAKKGVKATELTRDGLKDLSAQQKKTGKSTKNLKEKTGSLIGKLGKVASVAGLAAAAVGAVGTVMRTQTITEMKVMADTLNLSTQTLSEWTVAGEKFNVGGDKMADIFKDLQDKIGDFAATGGGEAKDIFEKLNLDINEFAGLSADKQLLKIGAALDGVASHGEKIFYLEALANDASRLIPLLENGAKGLRSAQEEARLLGTSINDVDAEMIAVAGREFQRTGDIVTGLGNVITAELAPALGAMNGGITDIVLGFGGWEGIVGVVVDYTVQGIAFIGDRIDTLRTILLTVGLGYLEIGKFATSSMASSATSVAELINLALDPLTDILSLIAQGWSQIITIAGEFTGDEAIINMGKSLASFSADIKDYSVDAADIIAADDAMSLAIKQVTKDIEKSKNAASGDEITNWYKNATKAAKETATATVAVKNAQRELGLEAAAAQKSLADDKQQVQDKMDEENKFYQNAIDGVNGYSEAWSSAGNVIIDTFGSIGQQMEKLFTSQDAYTKAIDINHKKQKAAGADVKKLKIEESKLDYANTQNKLNSYSSMAGAAASMFKENSKAAKVAHAIEQGLAITSLAMSVKKMVMGATETTAVVAQEGIKQVALGTTAVITQGQGDPYTAWARIAAMITVVAGLGIAISGSSSGSAPASSEERQKTQGTGTLLGSDDKSSSLNNSFERIEELELDQYAELRQMNGSLRDLNNNITHLATSFARNFGKFDGDSYSGELGSKSTTSKLEGFLIGGLEKLDPTGVLDKVFSSFSSKKRSLIDSGISIVSQTFGDIVETGLVQAQQYFDIKTKKKKFWGASSSKSYSTEFEDVNQQLEHELALIFTDIGSSITGAVDALGITVATDVQDSTSNLLEHLNDTMVMDFNNASFDPQAIENYVNNISGELGEATARSLDNFVIDLPRMSFKDLSGEEIQAELEGILSSQADLMATYLVPGLAEFQQVGEGLYETLIRLAQEQSVFNSILEITGGTLANIDANQAIVASQAIIEFAGGIENLQSAANTFFNEFFDEGEKFTFLQKKLKEQFDAVGESLPATSQGFKDLVSGLNPLNEADQKRYAQLLLLSEQTAEYYDAVESQKEKEKELAQARADFSKDITTQLALFDVSPVTTQLFNLQQDFKAYADNAKSHGLGTEMIEKLHAKKRQVIVDSALASINDTHQRELDKLNSSHTSAVSRLVSTNEKMSASISGVAQSIAGSILNLKRKMTGWDEVGYQSSNVKKLRSDIGTGDISNQLSSIEKLSAALQSKYQAEIDNNNQLNEIANERYQNDLSNYQTLADAAKNLKKAADDLRFGELSTHTSTEQFGFAKSAFESAGTENLQGAGQQYLEQAKNYYGGTASNEYQAIFDQVTNAFGSVNVGSAPSVPAQTTRYQTSNIELQNNLLAELESLQILTDELNTLNEESLTGEMATLADRYDEAIAVLDEQLQAQTADFVHSITNGLGDVVSAINSIEIPAPAAPIIIKTPPIVIHSPPPVKEGNTQAGNNGNSEQMDVLITAVNNQTSEQTKQNNEAKALFEAMEMRMADSNGRMYTWP